MNKQLNNLPVAYVSITKSEVSFSSHELKPEENVTRVEVAAAEISNLADELRQWIQDGKFSKIPKDLKAGTTQFLLSKTENLSTPFWFVGDLHGDLIALKTLTDFAREQNKRDGITTPTQLIFVGDFVDGAPFSAEVVAWMMKHWNAEPYASPQVYEASSQLPFKVMATVGNHDDGLVFSEDDTGGRFVSSVLPSSVAEEINQRIAHDKGVAWKEFGITAIAFFKALPRMLTLDKTVMVAHGGVPHSDVPITKAEDLNSPQALSDFTWNRLHETAPKKIPNRESHGSQVGIKTFDAFITSLKDVAEIGFSPKIFVRGHDHHEGNFKHYESYKACQVFTINAFTLNRDYYGQKYRDLSLLRWVPNETNKMTIFRLIFENKGLEELWSALIPSGGNDEIHKTIQ